MMSVTGRVLVGLLRRRICLPPRWRETSAHNITTNAHCRPPGGRRLFRYVLMLSDFHRNVST
jgi:hypothetical protein